MMNFSQILRKNYLEEPESVAVQLLFSQGDDLTITYRQLLRRSACFAYALKQAGVKPGEIVILVLNHGEDLLTAFIGAVLGGVIPSIMPFLTEKLSPEVYRRSLAALFEITAPAAVIISSNFREEVKIVSEGTSVRSILITEEIEIGILLNEEIAFQQLEGLKCSGNDTVLLQHSSGTTGLQKGVALSHQAVFNQIESYSQALKLNSEDVIVSWLPLYHDMGLIAGFILPLLKRIPLVLLSPFEWVRAPYRLMRAISQHRGTLCWLPNFAYNFSAQKIRDRDLEDIDLSSLRAVINCSEPMYWNSHKIFLDRFKPAGLRPEALATSYAMAENVFAVTQGGIDSPVVVDRINQADFFSNQFARPVDQMRKWGDSQLDRDNQYGSATIKMLSAGCPIDGTRVRVVDSHKNEIPERHIGEIILHSNCMLTGYYNRPDLTEQAFHNGWYCTGDLGYLAQGELFVTGRKKDLIIVGGKNIYPQDLENIAGEVEGVHPGRVVAFGLFNEETGTEDVVIIAESDHLPATRSRTIEETKTTERIADEIRQKVTRGSAVALRYVLIVGRNWLIKTSSGKIARRANRDKYLAEISQAS